jgi:quercetin dioxygenase-like cupin family protein
LTTSEESAGACFRLEYRARAVTGAPPDHSHADLVEQLEVTAGRLHCRIDGTLRVLDAGESLTFAPGVQHSVWNESPEGSRTIAEFRPAGSMQALFELAFPIVTEEN